MKFSSIAHDGFLWLESIVIMKSAKRSLALATLLLVPALCFAETPETVPAVAAPTPKTKTKEPDAVTKLLERLGEEATVPEAGADPATYIDDEKFQDELTTRLIDLAKKNKCLASSDIQKLLLSRKTCQLSLPPPSTKALTPEEVYERAAQSVMVLCSIQALDDDPGEWEGGRTATAWALTEDGVMITNRHVFEDLKDERFGVANLKGEVFPVIDILAASTQTDIVVFRVAGKGFTPLPLSRDEKIASWVGVLSHPGSQFFSFTQGFVTRYTKTNENGRTERWMSITADFASGSSGAPVLNKYGAVVGIATTTENIDSNEGLDENGDIEETPRKPVAKDEDLADNPEYPINRPSSVQMVVKSTIPSRVILELIRKK